MDTTIHKPTINICISFRMPVNEGDKVVYFVTFAGNRHPQLLLDCAALADRKRGLDFRDTACGL